MGTSSASPGTPPRSPSDAEMPDVEHPDEDLADLPSRPKYEEEDPKRLSAARTGFTKYLGSGGSDVGGLSKALSSYVSRGIGGASAAAGRMTTEARAVSQLVSLLSSFEEQGVAETLMDLSLDELAAAGPEEILSGMMDIVCPDGGTIDQAIARDAYAEMVVDMLGQGVDVTEIGSAAMAVCVGAFITGCIVKRVINDIGNQYEKVDLASVTSAETQLRDVVRGMVSDAITSEFEKDGWLHGKDLDLQVRRIFRKSFELMEMMLEAD